MNNHGYEAPSEGATNGHVPLNDNFEQLGTDVEIRAPESELSSNPRNNSTLRHFPAGLNLIVR